MIYKYIYYMYVYIIIISNYVKIYITKIFILVKKKNKVGLMYVLTNLIIIS